MSIQEISQKINRYISIRQLFWLITVFGVVFLLVGLTGLALHMQKRGEITIQAFNAPAFSENDTVPLKIDGAVYASKTGKRYYYSDCSGLKRIKSENLISFASAAMAERAGYTKAVNCH